MLKIKDGQLDWDFFLQLLRNVLCVYNNVLIYFNRVL